MYKNFLLKYILTFTIIIVLLQIYFFGMAIHTTRRSITEVDEQILASFKTAARITQSSVHDDGAASYGDGVVYQRDGDNANFFRYYYTSTGTGIERTPEYKRYGELIDNHFTLYDNISDLSGNTSDKLYHLNLMEDLGFVPMDFALPYIQLSPIPFSYIGSKNSETFTNQDGSTSATMTFDTDIVSETHRILLRTLSAGFNRASWNDAEQFVRIVDTNGDITGIPDIKLTLGYYDSSGNFRPYTDPSDLDEVLKFTTNFYGTSRSLGPVLNRNALPDNYMFKNMNDRVAYYDLVLKAEYTVSATLFAWAREKNIWRIDTPVTKYYRITYSLLS